ncbi:MAG: proton-conducting transporter membrane subunit [Legionella sp.]
MTLILLLLICLSLACPILAILSGFWIEKPTMAAAYAGYCIGIGLLSSLVMLGYVSFLQVSKENQLLSINGLNALLTSLVLLVSFIVHRFSIRYMYGDKYYRQFFILLSLLTFALLMMVTTNHLLLFAVAWCSADTILIRLMTHKKEWVASRESGIIAAYSLGLGCTCLILMSALLFIDGATTNLSMLMQQASTSNSISFSIASGLLVITILAQSGLFPFHQWLLSSLNSPTPVSAIMHGGLINGGGLLLVKFSPLFVCHKQWLIVLFLMGSLSALLGTIWKLMQHDVKKMLACSTMAQMGFMLMQCGLGLFSSAIAHICWHGLFKAYLFLTSGSAVTQKKPRIASNQYTLLSLLMAPIGGLCAMASFSVITDYSLMSFDANTFVLAFVFITGTQLLLTSMGRSQHKLACLASLLLAAFLGFIYGGSVHLIEKLLLPSLSNFSQSLGVIHGLILFLFAVFWLLFNVGGYEKIAQSKFGCWLYINLFNASLPAKKTVTSLRTDYNY